MTKQSKTFVPSAQNLQFTNEIVQSLDALSVARENWEQTAFKKANEGLYDLLAQCQEVFETKYLNATKNDQKALRLELTERCTAMGMRVLKVSATLTLLVRYVFASDRKRAHGYSNVIDAAISHGVSAKRLPEWIAIQGGIEEVKRKAVKSDEAKERMVQRTKAKETAEQMFVEAQINPLATVAIKGFKPEPLNIMLAVGDVNGNFNVTYVLTEVPDALYNALLKQAAKQIVADQERDDALTTEVAKYAYRQSENDPSAMKIAA